MSRTAPADRANALQVVLTIIAVAAGGLLLLLVILAVVGGNLFTMPAPGIDPAMAGLAVGKVAPDISAPAWVNGEPRDLNGKYVVVHGWFYDCPYCWQEAPHIAELHDKYGDRVAFVGLSSDAPDAVELVEEFVAKTGIEYPVGYGAIETLIGFDANAFPAVWIVGPDGKVVWNRAVEGTQSLEDALEAALKNELTAT